MEKFKNSATQNFMLPQNFQNNFSNSTPAKYYPISSSISSSSINTGYNFSSSPGYTSNMQDDPFMSQSQIETQRFLEKRPENSNLIKKLSAFQPPVHQRPRYISETGTDATYISNSSINQAGRNQLQIASHNKRRSDFSITNSERVVRDEIFDDLSDGNRSFSLLRNVYTERKSSIQFTILVILLGVTAAAGTIFFLTVIPKAEREFPADNHINITSVQNQLPTAAPLYTNQLQNNTRKVPPGVPTTPAPITTATEKYPNPKTSTKFPVGKAKRPNIKPMSNFPDLDVNTSNNYKNNRKPINYMQINSAADFKKLETATVEAISINQLVDLPEPDSNGKHVHVDLSSRSSEQIKHLKISGPITEEWLSCILKKFNKVENLTINVDELCIGATVGDRESLEPLKLENVQSLYIENLHFCTISSWVFKWELPKIQKLRIHNSDLTKKRFESLHGFLERRKNVLNSVVISKSFICPECSFADVQSTNLRMNIEVLDQLKNPFMSS